MGTRTTKAAGKAPVAVDLFCGVGGLTHGLAAAGIQVAAGIDVDPTCEYAYVHNNATRFILADVDDLPAATINALYPANCHRILVGCAPCQPFSRYTKGRSPGEKWRLIEAFGRLIRDVHPDVISMENVPELERHPVFAEFISTLEEEYAVSYGVVNCADFGVPQLRHRLVLLASRMGKIDLPAATRSPDDYVTVRDAIWGLPPLEAGEACSKDPLHRCSALNELNQRRVAATPPGGSWRDWPEKLRLRCHRKRTGRGYSSVYGRLDWELPARTITTQCFGLGNGRFGHPEQNRAISLREAALLQSFPADYRFIESGEHAHISVLGRHIGNAIPVRLANAIGETIVRHLGGSHV